MADDLNNNLEEQQNQLEKLRKEIEKLTKTALTKQQRQLQKLRREYAEQSKKVQALTKDIKSLSTEKTQLTKVTEQLTSKFGGTAGAVTRFTGGLKDSVFTLNQATGTMKAFGQQTTMTSTKFAGYAAAIQLAIAATIAFLEWVDRAEIKQGKLQRALGSTGVSIGASMKAQAEGYKVAGEAGEKVATDLTTRIAKARRGLFERYGVGEGGADFKKLITLSAGMSEQVPQWLTMLTETFAMGAGPEGASQIKETFESIGIIAQKSGVPIDMLGNMIFDLAKEFVHLGVDVDDTTGAVVKFTDEMGRSVITPAVGMAVMRNVFQQQRTATGLQGRLMTAAFSAQVFDSLGEDVKDLLNISAVKLTGDKRATWESLGIAQQAEALRTMDKGPYIEVQRGLYEMMKKWEGEGTPGEGEMKAMAVSRQILGIEWETARNFFENVLPGLAPKEAAEKFEEARKRATEGDKEAAVILKEATENFYKYVNVAAENQKEFTADLRGIIKDWQAMVLGEVETAKKEGVGLVGQAGRGTARGLEYISPLPMEQAIMTPRGGGAGMASAGLAATISRLIFGGGEVPTTGTKQPKGMAGVEEGIMSNEVEAGGERYILESKLIPVGSARVIDGKPSTDASGVPLRD